MKESVDLHKIAADFEDKGLTEIDETVGVWTFAIDDLPVTLKIKVVRGLHGKYSGIANYYIQAPESMPYISIKMCDTVEKALFDSLNGFLSNWNPKYKDETKFKPLEDW